MHLETLLQTRFGFSSFRPGQREAIESLLSHGRLLCIHPTGRGKSLLYQLPTCLLEGMTIVISPLLALMRDQLTHLSTRFSIPAATINSDQSEEENAAAKAFASSGGCKILFIAPEQLDHVDKLAFLLTLNVSLVVVDEAHCISTWGHDFRPSYRQILSFLTLITQQNSQIKILGLTATADQRVEADITRQLTLSDKPVVVMRETMDRPNIALHAFHRKGLAAKLQACVDLIRSDPGCGLIYCATRENVELVADFLRTQNIDVAAYHAGIEAEDKRQLQADFLADRYKALVATNALGMGIDKSNLRFIIHFDVPGSITAYYQEVGRCGRDGLPAKGILLFDPADQAIQEYFIDSALPSPENFKEVVSAIASAQTPPNLSTIKRLTGLHPTRVTIIIAELLEQEFISKSSLSGVQVYQKLMKETEPDLSRYDHQQIVKREELQRILAYGKQSQKCRMAILREALGDLSVEPCGHCDVCAPTHDALSQQDTSIIEWLNDRPLPIAPMAQQKVSAGISLLHSTVRSPLFIRFMKERAVVSSHQEMDPELIALLLRHFGKLVQEHGIVGLIPIMSSTWKGRSSIVDLLATHFAIPAFPDLLRWKEPPPKRQGELLNNDQRHHNVHQRMEADTLTQLPTGPLILFDDYIGSGNTMREAARALRATKQIKNELIPFTIAAVKWHLGKPGFS